MTYILCIETATDICSVSISGDGACLSASELPEGNRHSAGLTNLIRKVCEEAGLHLKDMSAVAISDGPGSYTGLRVGSSTAKAICFALDIPLIAVPSLMAIAQGMRDYLAPEQQGTLLIPTIDARRMEVYAAIYDSQLNEQKAVYSLLYTTDSIKELQDQASTIIIGGNGAQKLLESDIDLTGLTISPSLCNAGHICPIAYHKYQREEWVNVAYHTPYYHKSPNITKPKAKV